MKRDKVVLSFVPFIYYNVNYIIYLLMKFFAVLDKDAFCFFAYTLTGKVVYRSISVKCVVCYVVDAACAGFKFNIAYTDLCAVQEHL